MTGHNRTKEAKRLGAVLLIIGLILATVGQFYFTYQREYVWDGVAFWVAGILSLSLMVRRFMRSQRGLASGREARPRWLSSLQEHPIRSLMAVGGLCFSFTAGWLASGRSPGADFTDLFVLWVVGVVSFLLAQWSKGKRPADRLGDSFSLSSPIAAGQGLTSPLREVWQRSMKLGDLLRDLLRDLGKRPGHGLGGRVVALAIVALLALVVRVYDLEHIPANLGGDEGTWAIEGLAMLDGRLANPFATRWFAFPSMSFLVWGVSMRVFGETVAGVRAISALIGTASVLTTFLLARKIWGRLGDRIAWLAALVLAVGHYHLHFSRLAVNNIADSLLVTVALWLLIDGLRSSSMMSFALAGVVIGAGWYGYFGARLVGIIVASYLGWRMVTEHRFLARYGHHLLVLLGGALVVTGPLLIHYAAHPTALTEGFDRVSIFASGWLAREQEITGRSALDLLAQQFWKSISAFNYTLDPTFWYRPGVPLLDFVSGVLFIFGLIWSIAHWRWSSSALLLIWFWSALVTGWVTTENPPSSQRMVILTPALALFVALGLERLLQLCRRLLGASQALVRGIAVVALLAIVALNLNHYFLVYTPSRVYGNPTAELTTHLARRLARQDEEIVVYLHGPPFVYWDFGTLRFMARGVAGIDVPPPGEIQPPKPDLSREAWFVFHPARLDELESVRGRYPGGGEKRFRSSADGKLLYAVYEVSR